MSFTLCSSGAIVIKAGANINSAASASSAILEQYSNEAEGLIDIETRRNWTGSYSSLASNMKNLLASISSNIAAKRLINYDVSGFPSEREAELRMDVLTDDIKSELAILKDSKSNELRAP